MSLKQEYFTSKWHRIQKEVIIQLKTSIPASLGSIVYKIPQLISVAFVGRIGADELAAAALATTLCNVTGLSLALGLSSAVTTLTGQSKGDMDQRRKEIKKRNKLIDSDSVRNNYKANGNDDHNYGSTNSLAPSTSMFHNPKMTPRTYLFRGLFIQLMFVLPVGIYWIYGIKSLLIYLGQENIIAEMAQNYLRALTPGLWTYSINFTLTSWLQAIEMADVPFYGGLVGLIFHVPLNILFIYTLQLGYLGAAIATSLSQTIQLLATFLYICLIPNGKQRIYTQTGADTLTTPIPTLTDINNAIFSYEGVFQYLSLAVPGIIIISEWWASEIAIFLAGHLPSPAISLASMSIYQSINSFCFMFSVGISVACSTRVSNLLGSRDPNGAHFAANVSIVLAGVMSTLLGFGIFVTPHTYFPSLFTTNDSIIEEAGATISYLSLYLIADGMQYTINGVVKGCGRQCVVMPIVIFAYWVVGLPLAYFMAFHWEKRSFNLLHGNSKNILSIIVKYLPESFHGVTGLVFGMTMGTWVHFILLAFIVALNTNWTLEAEKAQARITLEQIKEARTKTKYVENRNNTLSEETTRLTLV